MTQADVMRAAATKYGVANIAHLKAAYWRTDAAGLAARYGLPDDLHPHQVRIVVALAGGPKGVADLLAACGLTPTRGFEGFNISTRPWRGNLLSGLCKRGLVAKSQEVVGGKGRTPAVYLLTAAAMDLLGAAA